MLRAAGRMRGRMALLGSLTLGILGVACVDAVGRQQSDAAIFAWMQCHDCLNGERARVVALGDTAVPRLRHLLLDGPPPEHVAAVESQLDRLARDLPVPGVLTPEVRAAQLEGFRELYRLRAASALAGIGSADAQSALCAPRLAPPPGPLRDAVDSALARIGRGPCP